MKILSLSIFLYDIGKINSIQVKSQNLYSIEFSKGFEFLLFFQLIPNFCRYLHPKFDENSIFIKVFINLGKIISIQVKSQN